MKNVLFLLLTIVCLNSPVIAQHSSLNIFSDDGHPFTLLINGVQQNETPESNVLVEGLDHDFCSIKVNFDKKAFKSVEQKELILKSPDGGDIDAIYVLRGIKKNKFKLELYMVTPAQNLPELSTLLPSKDTKESVEKTVELEVVEDVATVEEPKKVEKSQEEIDAAKRKEELIAALSAKLDKEDIETKSSSNEPDVKVTKDVDVKIVGNKKTTTTTTTTITTTGRSIQRDVHIDVMTEYVGNSNVKNSRDNKTPVGTGCRGAQLADSDFNDSKKNIISKTNESEKLEVAKQIASIACLASHQVKDIMLLFSKEETKLEFAKFAYSRTVDTHNYEKVAIAFNHSETMNKLKAHMAM